MRKFTDLKRENHKQPRQAMTSPDKTQSTPPLPTPCESKNELSYSEVEDDDEKGGDDSNSKEANNE